MHSIPPRVLELLAHEPPVVVAPVGLGFAQADLEWWAQQTKRRVLRNLSELTPGVKALVMPSSRSQLANLPTGLESEQVLFLQETDLLFSLEEWQQALEPETGWRVTQAYLETGGWPEGLALARSFIVQGIQGPLVRHPQCAARLGSLLPGDISHETLVRLARSPVFLPAVYGLLGLDENQVATLYDRGLLYAQGAGLALPRLLRLNLRGPTPTETVDALEATLRDHGHTDAALELLAEHGLWERYLWLLTETFAADRGERYLRPLLRLVPPRYRSQPTYRYLNTFLARFVGDTESMARTLEALLPQADDRLKPYVLNAYGVSFGMKAKYAQAAAIFRQALGELPEAASKIKADLLHNLGLAWYYLGNLRMARELFIRSSALCCELGLYDQEAANLISLSSLENSLGNPQAALAALERAMPHLADGTSKLHLAAENRANAMLMMGDLPGAEAKLLALPKRPHDRRVQLIVKLALGYVGLWKGNYRAALSMAEEILQCGFDDQHLISEAHLLLSKIAYQKGQPALAKTHLSKVEQDYRAMAEAAWQGLADLDEAVADMRQRGAKFELAQLLLRKGGLDSLREALVLCQTHGYGLLLQHRLFAPYWRALVLADNESRRAFPLRLQTFGAFSAELLGVRCNLAEGFRTRKAALLLIFLALHPGPHSRERLAEVFWSDTSSPLASLNTAISDLRRLFKAPLIEGNKRQVWLGFPVSSDLEEFVQASEPYLKQPLPAQPNDLEALLSRFALEWLPEFADWFAEERSALEARQAKLWRRLAEHYRRSAPHKALGAYRRVVRLEPYDAETWNELATLYQALGEPALARQALTAMRKALGELDSSLLRPV